MSTTLEADLPAFQAGGWQTVELWLTKLETYLQGHSVAEVRDLLASSGLLPAAAAGQGGLLLSGGAHREAHWSLFRSRLAVLRDLQVPTLILASDSISEPTGHDYQHAAAMLGEAAVMAGDFGVRIALEFQKTSGFCSSLDTALALVEQCGSRNAGVCVDVFHYYTGPSKFEDLAYLSKENLFWVQVCDLSATPRELAGDRDRILPGDGDFLIKPILDQIRSISYDGHVSLEVLNPQLWQVPADRVADLGYQAVCRVLGPRNQHPPGIRGGS